MSIHFKRTYNGFPAYFTIENGKVSCKSGTREEEFKINRKEKAIKQGNKVICRYNQNISQTVAKT